MKAGDPGVAALVGSQDLDVGEDPIIERVAALDIGKAELVCCVRTPTPTGRRRQQVRTFSTMTRSLMLLRDWLTQEEVTVVGMESTGVYWKSPYYLLEDLFDTRVLNATQVKNVPGRPKTDKLDAVWLCKLVERGMVRSSFVPPPPIRELRNLTRYRAALVAARTAEKERVEKLLEDAQVKLSVVASDIFGKSGRLMMAALIDGVRDPAVLADLALGRLRSKTVDLQEAFVGQFSGHHARLLAKMLTRVDALTADVTDLDEEIAQALGPHEQAVSRLIQIPGVDRVIAAVVIAEIGLDMTRFLTPAHLTSWARLAPIARESAGRTHGRQGTGKGNRYLAAVLGDAAVGAGKTHTFLGARYRRLGRRGRDAKNKAIVAVGRSILVIIWHLLADEQATYLDLGEDHYARHTDRDRKVRNHVRDLQALGYRVILEPA
ncbi:MAG: IS110 family transposase [Intrasporangium sp.]|uniref:IS110 family transposase n=1 Tax=Intrasporangium sp. TaxID=1925024 RepID=UPI003F806A2F